MGDIYSNAESTISWLGLPENEDSDQMAAFFEHIAEQISPIYLRGVINLDAIPKALDLLHGGVDRFPMALSKLFQHSYWSRAWVVQEVLLAKRIIVWRGSRKIPLDILNFLTTLSFKPNRFYAGSLMVQLSDEGYRGQCGQAAGLR